MYVVVGLGLKLPVDPKWIKRKEKEGTLKTYIEKPLPFSTDLTLIEEVADESNGGSKGKIILRPKVEKKK